MLKVPHFLIVKFLAICSTRPNICNLYLPDSQMPECEKSSSVKSNANSLAPALQRLKFSDSQLSNFL